MANHVYAISEVVGTSPNAVAKASTTVRNLDWFEVLNVRGQIADDAVAHWQVTVKLGFRLED